MSGKEDNYLLNEYKYVIKSDKKYKTNKIFLLVMCFYRETRKEDMKNFLIHHLSDNSSCASAGILGCLADGIDVQYECWDSMTVKALTPDKVEFLRHLFQSLIGSVTLKCDFAEKRTCRESRLLYSSACGRCFVSFVVECGPSQCAWSQNKTHTKHLPQADE